MDLKVTLDDGFSHRFVTLCPEPAEIEAEDIRQAIESIISLQNLFLLVKMIHEVQRKYVFDEEALEIYDLHFNSIRKLARRANRFDSCLG